MVATQHANLPTFQSENAKTPTKLEQKRHVLASLALVACSIMAGCVTSNSEPTRQPVSRDFTPSIMSMGDSMMAWHRISGRSIADELGRQLGTRVVDRSVTAARFNYILPITGAMGLNISKQYKAGNWDWVVVNGGGNDLWFGCGCFVCDLTLEKLISIDAETGKIPSLISRIREDGAKVVFLGYLHSPGSFSIVDHCKDEAEEFERRLTLLTKKQNGFFFLNLARTVPNGDTSFHSLDGIHPSLKASKAIGQMVAETIRTNTP